MKPLPRRAVHLGRDRISALRIRPAMHPGWADSAGRSEVRPSGVEGKSTRPKVELVPLVRSVERRPVGSAQPPETRHHPLPSSCNAAVRGKGGGGPTKRVPHDGKAPVALFPKQDCLSDLGCPRPSPCYEKRKGRDKIFNLQISSMFHVKH